MGGRAKGQCRSLEEDIYWTHFQFLHFTQFLCSDYHQHLELPKTFSDNIKKKLPENVTLKGPGGVEWNIGLTTKDDTVNFTHGWQQFAKDNSLKENDFLVFKYNGESLFEVLMFDGESFCEKAASYFVRKCGLAISEPNGGGCSSKKRDQDTDNFVEEINTPSNGSDEYASPEKSTPINSTEVPLAVPLQSETPNEKNLNIGVESASPEQIKDDTVTPTTEPAVTPTTEPAADPVPVPFRSTGKRIRRPVYAVNTVQKKRKGRPPKAYSSLNRLAEAEPSSVGKSAEPSSVGKSEEPSSVGKSEARGSYTSNRRTVTDIEIQTTLQLAQAACPAEGLHIVMRPTHVYRRFYVALPNSWILKHLSRTSQEVILRSAKGEWLAKYSYQSYRDTGGLTSGWKQFTVDNNLEEFDVCVFKPAGHMNKILILNVSIFRVVEKITPLTGVKSPAKKSPGKWRGIGRHGKNATDTVETEIESIGVTKAKPVAFRSPTTGTRTAKVVYKRKGRPAKASSSRAGELTWVTDNKVKAVDNSDSSDMVVEAKCDPSFKANKDIIST